MPSLELRTVQRSGIKILAEHCTNYSDWFVAAHVDRDPVPEDVANFRLIQTEIEKFGEPHEKVATPCGLAILLPPDVSAEVKESVENIAFLAREGQALDPLIYFEVINEIVGTRWRIATLSQRLELCRRAETSPRIALEPEVPVEADMLRRLISRGPIRPRRLPAP